MLVIARAASIFSLTKSGRTKFVRAQTSLAHKVAHGNRAAQTARAVNQLSSRAEGKRPA